MSRPPLLVIAAGGTGGHMFPAQALAEQMLVRGWRVTLSTDARGARYAGAFPEGVPVRKITSATFARGGLAAKIAAPFRILTGIIEAIFSFISERPTVVAGFGGYPSIPALAAAWTLRVPRLIHEQNGVLGRVNQVFARRVNAVACGTWPTEMPPSVSGLNIGNPVRQAVLDVAETAFPSADEPLHILVMGGSQGARVLSDVVPHAISQLPGTLSASLSVSHQARPEDDARVREIYSSAGIDADIQPFFEDVPERIARSRLVISRSGASSVADISVIGRPSILIPLAAAIRDEQTANAQGLVDADASVILPESELDPSSLCEQILAILSVPGIAEQMAKNAKSKGIPDATERLADVVENLVRRKRI